MEQKDPRQIQAELAMPFAPEDLEWRLQKVVEAKEVGIAVPYVTNRAIMGRLDNVVGPENWYNEFRPWHGDGKKQAQLCGISIRYGDGFITKWDGAEDSDIEPVNGGLSDSMKRAAVQWGIGRVLYNMDVFFVEVEKRGKTWYIKKDQQNRLDNAYLKMLGKLGLTPAPAGGLQIQTGPSDDGGDQAKEPRQGNTQDKPTGEKPAEKPQKDNIAYLIRNMRVNKGIKSTNTQLVLESSKGERVDAFARGEHPELVIGVTLIDVKLELKKTDTVIYYIIDDEKQRSKMTEEFYAAVKKEIAEYQERADYFIKSGSQSPAVMERWVLKIRALEEKKKHYEGVLRRELDGLDDEFATLKFLSQELQVRVKNIRFQKAA